MLIIVSLVFFISWAPINIYNLVLDVVQPFKVTQHTKRLVSLAKPLQVPVSPSDQRHMLTIFAVCHLAAMSTAITNPVLYGFLNENFKQVRVGCVI